MPQGSNCPCGNGLTQSASAAFKAAKFLFGRIAHQMLSRIGEEVHHQSRKNCEGAACSKGINREGRNNSHQGKSERDTGKGTRQGP